MSATSWGDRHAHGDPGDGPSTRVGFRHQFRVVHALLLREMQTRFGRNQLGFLWLFMEPLMVAGAMAGLRWLVGGPGTVPGVPIFIFALVSYLPFFSFRSIVSRAPGTLRSTLSLLYHSRIKLLDLVLARHGLEMAAVVVVMAFIVVGVAFWADMPPNSVPMLLIGLVLILLLANGLGLLCAAAAARWPAVGRVIHVLLFLSLPLSGALVSLHMLDPAIREVLLWNPQAHMHEMVRDGFFGDRLPSHYDVGYAVFWVGVLNLLGLAALRAVRPKLEI